MWQEYLGFKFKKQNSGCYFLKYPSGFMGLVFGRDEEAIKKIVDDIIRQFKK
jgi:hypothetical protein